MKGFHATIVTVEKQKIYSECVFVALGIQHAMRMRHFVILWPVRLYNIFPHNLINGTIYFKKLFGIKRVF